MAASVHGIHHVTCIAGDPQQNIDFYCGVLGMRLVKKSVNQDAPDTYHLFYADAVGTPGTDLTFFPWKLMKAGIAGTGLAMEVTLAIPPGSLGYWRARLSEHNITIGPTEERFGETTLPFQDFHGLRLGFVETGDERPFVPWNRSAVPEQYQIRGMHSVRLWERDLTPTENMLFQLGIEPIATDKAWRRYGVDGGTSGKIIEIQELAEMPRGRWGHGSIHHVAWRTTDAAEEIELREELEKCGFHPTEVIDRFWFKSVYFREPGGTLFEMATDGPGFGIDEDTERLGEKLVLPPWLEERRSEIEAELPSLTLP